MASYLNHICRYCNSQFNQGYSVLRYDLISHLIRNTTNVRDHLYALFGNMNGSSLEYSSVRCVGDSVKRYFSFCLLRFVLVVGF